MNKYQMPQNLFEKNRFKHHQRKREMLFFSCPGLLKFTPNKSNPHTFVLIPLKSQILISITNQPRCLFFK